MVSNPPSKSLKDSGIFAQDRKNVSGDSFYPAGKVAGIFYFQSNLRAVLREIFCYLGSHKFQFVIDTETLGICTYAVRCKHCGKIISMRRYLCRKLA